MRGRESVRVVCSHTILTTTSYPIEGHWASDYVVRAFIIIFPPERRWVCDDTRP